MICYFFKFNLALSEVWKNIEIGMKESQTNARMNRGSMYEYNGRNLSNSQH
jgi:hypothetical protein